jgi:hypothetical protein
MYSHLVQACRDGQNLVLPWTDVYQPRKSAYSLKRIFISLVFVCPCLCATSFRAIVYAFLNISGSVSYPCQTSHTLGVGLSVPHPYSLILTPLSCRDNQVLHPLLSYACAPQHVDAGLTPYRMDTITLCYKVAHPMLFCATFTTQMWCNPTTHPSRSWSTAHLLSPLRCVHDIHKKVPPLCSTCHSPWPCQSGRLSSKTRFRGWLHITHAQGRGGGCVRQGSVSP